MQRALGAMAKRLTVVRAFAAIAVSALSAPAHAQVPLADSGDNAWMLTACALALLAVLPGLALRYAGRVRAGNMLSVFQQILLITAMISLLWAIVEYSLVFSPGSSWIGGPSNLGLANLAEVRVGTAVAEPVFVLFQMSFAIIAPALMVGAMVERVRLGWLVPFALLWSLFVYLPVARWVWGGGWIAQLGALDFAGGIVVHSAAGISALILAVLIGKRRGFGQDVLPSHSPALSMAGTGLLWVGWFGLSGGQALTASADAALAILNIHLAAAAAALCWAGLERILQGKCSATGIATGAVAGLVTASCAAGLVGAIGAMLLGVAGGIACFFAARLIRYSFDIDDSLDVFAVHGVCGMLGALLLAPLASASMGGVGYAGAGGMAPQFVAQFVGVAAVILWSALWTLLLALAISLFLPMRVSAEEELEGHDVGRHG